MNSSKFQTALLVLSFLTGATARAEGESKTLALQSSRGANAEIRCSLKKSEIEVLGESKIVNSLSYDVCIALASHLEKGGTQSIERFAYDSNPYVLSLRKEVPALLEAKPVAKAVVDDKASPRLIKKYSLDGREGADKRGEIVVTYEVAEQKIQPSGHTANGVPIYDNKSLDAVRERYKVKAPAAPQGER